MKKQNKKGFTLVELLVVIAILAILGTVSIVGYTSFIGKAHLSNDQTVISELNTFIKAADVVDEIHTVTEANEALKEDGFDLTKLKPSSKNYRYAYDVKQKEFCLIDKDWNLVDYECEDKIDVFAFVDDVKDLKKYDDDYDANFTSHIYYNEKGYSTYLQYNFELEDEQEIFYSDKGIDNASHYVDHIFYTNKTGPEQSVVVGTSFGNLSVDGYVDSGDVSKGDVIYWYGSADICKVIKCATGCFHDCTNATDRSDAETLSVTQGNIVYDGSVKNKSLYFTTYYNETTKRWVTNENIIISTIGSDELPELPQRGKLSGKIGEIILLAKWQHLDNSTQTTVTEEKTDYIKIKIQEEYVDEEKIVAFRAFVSPNNSVNTSDSTSTDAISGYEIGQCESLETLEEEDAVLEDNETDVYNSDASEDIDTKYEANVPEYIGDGETIEISGPSDVVYTSEDSSIISVDGNKLTAHSRGEETTIYAERNGKKKEFNVYVSWFHEELVYFTDPFVIANEKQMQNYFEYLVYGDYAYLSWKSWGYDYTTTVKLINDIDMSKVVYHYNCTGVKKYVFEGNGHTISNGTRPLFACTYLTGSVTIKNLTLNNFKSNTGLFYSP